MNKLGKRVLTGLLTVPVALSMPISVSAYALEDGSDEILVAAAESAEIVYDAVAVADDAAEATDAADATDSTDVVADVMAAVENSEAGVVAMAADVPVAVAEEATAGAITLAKTIVSSTTDPAGYDSSKVSVNGDTVKLLADFESTSYVAFKTVAKLDLAGHKVNIGAKTFSISAEGASLTIIDSVGGGMFTNDGSKTLFQVYSGGKLIVEDDAHIESSASTTVLVSKSGDTPAGSIVVNGGSIINTHVSGKNDSANAVVLKKGATADISGGNIRATGGIYSSAVYIDSDASGESKLNIEGGNIESTGWGVGIAGATVVDYKTNVSISGGNITGAGALTVQGTARGITLDITGGTFTGNKANGLYLAGDAVTTISGATISGDVGILARGGKLTIENANITGASEGDVEIGDTGTTVPASAVVVDIYTRPGSGYGENQGATIIDGEYIGAVLVVDTYAEDTKVAGNGKNLLVKGGNFSESFIEAELTSYLDSSILAELLSKAKNENAPYSYHGLKDALALLNDEDENETVTFISKLAGDEIMEVHFKAGYKEIEVVSFYNKDNAVGLPTYSSYFDGPDDGREFVGWISDDDEMYYVGDVLEYNKNGYNLTAVWVDKTALREAIEDAEGVAKNNYTPSTVAPFEDAIEDAKAVLEDKKATQEDVDNAIKVLEETKNALKKVANKTELKDAITAVEALNEDDYTPNSWAESGIEEALEHAKNVKADPEVTQAEADEAAAALREAISKLVERADLTALEEAVASADELDENTYTPNSWAELEDALAEAEEVLANPNATQEEVDAATAKVNEAIENLQERADFSELEEAVSAGFEAVAKAEEAGDYTDESVAALLEALLNALENIDENSSQEDVDAATQAILDAIAGLEKVEQPIEVPSVPKTNDDIVNWVLMMATSVSMLTMLGYGAIAAKAKAKASKK